jgi:hypothetical protein
MQVVLFLLTFVVAILVIACVSLLVSLWALQDKVEAIGKQAVQSLGSSDRATKSVETISTAIERLKEDWRDVDHRTKWSGADGTTTEEALGRLKGVETDLGGVRKELVAAGEKFKDMGLDLKSLDGFQDGADARLGSLEARVAVLERVNQKEGDDAQA